MAADGERSPLLSEPIDGGAGGNGLVGPGVSGAGPGGGLTPSAPPYGAGKHAPPQGKPGRVRFIPRGAERRRKAGPRAEAGSERQVQVWHLPWGEVSVLTHVRLKFPPLCNRILSVGREGGSEEVE